MKNLLKKIKKRKKNINIYFFLALIIFFSVFAVYYEEYTNVTSDEISLMEYLDEMVAGNVYEQTFVCEYDNLEYVEVYFASYFRVSTAVLNAELYRGEEIIQEWEVKCSSMEDNYYYPFMLDNAIKDSAGETYTLRIYTNAETGNGITAYINTSGEYSGFYINGDEQIGQSLCYLLHYKNSLLDKSGVRYIFRFFIIFAVLFFVWIFLQVKPCSIEVTFLVFWIVLSGLYTCSGTLFNVPDEYGHIMRAYQVSHGEWVSKFDEETVSVGGELPFNTSHLGRISGKWKKYDANKNDVVLEEENTFVDFKYQALMSPVNYLPQAIGIYIARHLTNKLAIIVYAGRFANWLFATILFYFAIKILPKGKEFLCLVALLPLNLQESVSLASDGVVVALAALLIAFVMYLRYKQGVPMCRWQIAFMYIFAITISMYKIVYIAFCMLYFLIPSERFKRGKKEKYIHAAIMIVIVLVLNLGWTSIVSDFLIKRGTNSGLQLAYILQHAFRYYLVLTRTCMENGWTIIQEIIGGTTIENAVGMLTSLCCLQIILVTYRDRLSQKTITDRPGERFWLLFTILTVGVLIFTSLYFQWEYLYADSIGGLQGRYFMSLLLPIYLLVVKKPYQEEMDPPENLSVFSQFSIIVANVCVCMGLLFAYL